MTTNNFFISQELSVMFLDQCLLFHIHTFFFLQHHNNKSKLFSLLSLLFCSTDCPLICFSWQQNPPDSIFNQRVSHFVTCMFRGQSVLIQDSKNTETMWKRRRKFEREIEVEESKSPRSQCCLSNAPKLLFEIKVKFMSCLWNQGCFPKSARIPLFYLLKLSSIVQHVYEMR